MREERPHRSPPKAKFQRLAAVAAAALLGAPTVVEGFFEEFFGQAGGNVRFEMGGSGFGGGAPKKPKWPKGVTDKIAKNMVWLKGTEWNWNSWRNVKFDKDGTFDAPTRDCQSGQCLWSAGKNGKVYILWGEAGLHELDIIGEIPKEQDNQKMKGMQMRGKRVSDREPCSASFQRVYDFEAAALEKDLYEILGLPDDAEEADVKKVYRKLSIKYHPDKNPDEESKKKFGEVRDAYEILNDPDKKILYDTGGMEAVKKHEKGEVKKGDDVSSTIEVSLEDLYNGGTMLAKINRRVVCRGCRTKPNSDKCKVCSRCPNEVKTVHVQVGPGMFMQQQQEVQSKEKCKDEDTSLEVQIERGMRSGDQITFPRMAAQKPGMLPGDVVLTLKQKKNRRFERQGDDLHMNMKVSLREALLGWHQTIRHLDKHVVETETSSITRPYQVFKIKGEGMPHRDDPASFGDMYVKVEVEFPRTLTKEQSEAVANIFAPTPPRAEL
eukprot:CAMPEP_0206446244 /NCGR_PEP_ID=MMETSP0324_2-20121206/16019_1 /ASSEMBLY_ACC=CAM_ASM_000836 /TAXON_ID=2866 /ORGANISM="Crypthecodinium cohnii, Strain Seligo" /LENGTH=492 /DNA_ID=CAMNT_0053914675 /DNA_START=200 /DNA_END=1678 /DNA_ORIENTATION=-